LAYAQYQYSQCPISRRSGRPCTPKVSHLQDTSLTPCSTRDVSRFRLGGFSIGWLYGYDSLDIAVYSGGCIGWLPLLVYIYLGIHLYIVMYCYLGVVTLPLSLHG